jgi:hypothetical protein
MTRFVLYAYKSLYLIIIIIIIIILKKINLIIITVYMHNDSYIP